MIRLATVDSTNNYAMQLIDTGKAVHGLTIVAREQTAGKGQRGNSWSGMPGESLQMSVILKPFCGIEAQARFLAAAATTVAISLQRFIPQHRIAIKWPNDIFIDDKKAAGILIENVVRGSNWHWSVVGIGVNVGQPAFPTYLPNATSLWIASGEVVEPDGLAIVLRDALIQMPENGNDQIIDAYNSLLYRNGDRQRFRNSKGYFEGTVKGMNDAGQLLIAAQDGITQQYTHGSVEWVWM